MALDLGLVCGGMWLRSQRAPAALQVANGASGNSNYLNQILDIAYRPPPRPRGRGRGAPKTKHQATTVELTRPACFTYRAAFFGPASAEFRSERRAPYTARYWSPVAG